MTRILAFNNLKSVVNAKYTDSLCDSCPVLDLTDLTFIKVRIMPVTITFGYYSNLLKLKDFHDLSLPLLDVIPSEARPTHGNPIFYWDGAKDNKMGAGLSISHAEAEDLLANKDSHIGKMCEIRFFEYSDYGVPRHPVMHGFRLDK